MRSRPGPDLFEASGDEDGDTQAEPGESERCTPARLLAFIKDTKRLNKRMPTLRECQERFGGILGPMVDFWALKERGLV